MALPIPISTCALLMIVVIVASVFDFRYRRIPNWLVGAGALAGFVSSTAASGWHGLSGSLLGFLTGFLLYLPLYIVRARGAGDVKLLAAIGAIVGVWTCVLITVFSALLGGVVALGLILWKKRLSKTLLNVSVITHELLRRRMPYMVDEQLDVRHPESLRTPHALILASGCVTFLALGMEGIVLK
jgi:prepilin peptidase CpaA